MIIETIEINELIEGFLNGEDKKINALITAYYKFVYFNCVRILRDDEAAKDLTQDAFVRVYKYRNTYDKNFKFSNWLLKIATNACMDYLRKSNKDRARVLHIETIESGAGCVNDLKKYLVDDKFEAGMDEKFEKDLLNDIISLLPPIYRVTLVLKYYNDLSYEEISKILNIPAGTAKFRINRAKRIIIKLLSLAAENRREKVEITADRAVGKGSEQ